MQHHAANEISLPKPYLNIHITMPVGYRNQALGGINLRTSTTPSLLDGNRAATTTDFKAIQTFRTEEAIKRE